MSDEQQQQREMMLARYLDMQKYGPYPSELIDDILNQIEEQGVLCASLSEEYRQKLDQTGELYIKPPCFKEIPLPSMTALPGGRDKEESALFQKALALKEILLPIMAASTLLNIEEPDVFLAKKIIAYVETFIISNLQETNWKRFTSKIADKDTRKILNAPAHSITNDSTAMEKLKQADTLRASTSRTYNRKDRRQKPDNRRNLWNQRRTQPDQQIRDSPTEASHPPPSLPPAPESQTTSSSSSSSAPLNPPASRAGSSRGRQSYRGARGSGTG